MLNTSHKTGCNSHEARDISWRYDFNYQSMGNDSFVSCLELLYNTVWVAGMMSFADDSDLFNMAGKHKILELGVLRAGSHLIFIHKLWI